MSKQYFFSRQTKRTNNENLDFTIDNEFSLKIPKTTALNFIQNYKNNPINVFNVDSENIKGFYLDKKVIDAIKSEPNVESLYIYLAKTSTTLDKDYTLISILGTKDTNGKDKLMINQIFEWHDPVTKSIKKPSNEDEIGYSTTE